ncbi:MAG: hypothetical protein DMF87_09020 [Acidobacteria bacterium]|nr:MAG: hypothetical protein DMF87_09020 [Acidobacteriota bacterium]
MISSARNSVLLLVAVVGLAVMIDVEPSAQEPGSVRGRVSIDIPITARRPTSTYSRSVPTVALAPESELRHVVIYVKDAPKTAVAPMRAEIRQRNENFVPRVVAVTVGSTVDFPNDDPIYHNVFSLSRTKTFPTSRATSTSPACRPACTRSPRGTSGSATRQCRCASSRDGP